MRQENSVLFALRDLRDMEAERVADEQRDENAQHDCEAALDRGANGRAYRDLDDDQCSQGSEDGIGDVGDDARQPPRHTRREPGLRHRGDLG